MSLACVVIASEKRMNTTFLNVMASVLTEPFDEVVVVADFHCAGTWRHLMVPAITKTTIDALIKRDVGWVATHSENVLFLSDDHRVQPGFVAAFREHYEHKFFWGLLAPSRFVIKDGARIALNVGEREKYVAGHGGIYRRASGRILPWTAIAHHRNWDMTHSHYLIANGAIPLYAGDDLAIEDIEGGQPWV